MNGVQMISRIPVLLDEKTAAGLVALAKQEFRDPRQQAAVIIRDELVRRGFLPSELESVAHPLDTGSESKQRRNNADSQSQ
jgi:hypothetical protein